MRLELGAPGGPLLIRHGEKYIGAGAALDDPPLSERGRAQAAAVAASLAGESFTTIYTSPRRRARETAKIIGAKLGLVPVVCHELRNVPNGPRSLLSLFEVPPFALRTLAGRDCLVVTHGGTMLLILLTLGSWRQSLHLPQRVPHCRVFSPKTESSPNFGAPLFLLLLGLLLALLLVPGAAPGLPMILSFVVAFGSYWLAARLGASGKGAGVAAALVLAGLLLMPLAFGPSTQNNRKVMPFNSWAYDLGSYLPALPVPPPNPNGVAAVLVAGMALCGAAALNRSGRYRIVAASGFLLLGFSLLLTASRAGWLAGLAALLFLLRGSIVRYARQVAAPAGLILLLALPLLGAAQPGQPSIISLSSMVTRGEQWDQTLALLEDRPLTGLGPGRYPAAYAAAATIAGERPYKTPNNTLLELWSDAGLLGIIAALWAAALVFSIARRTAQFRSTLLDGVLAALVALAVHSVFETNTAIVWTSNSGYGYLASPLPFILLGLLAGAARETIAHRRSP